MADYCNTGGFRCKYCYDDECTFFSMGSGNIKDLPCRSQSFDKVLPSDTIRISREEFSTQSNLCIADDIPSGLNTLQKNLLYAYAKLLEKRLFDRGD